MVKNQDELVREIEMDLEDYSKKAIIALTEAPNSNLFGWASKIYETDGIRKVMVSTGFFDDKVWMSILFQIMAGLYALQIKGIYIKNFTLEDNVYIKDFYGTLLDIFTVSGVLDNQNYSISENSYLLTEASINQFVTEQKVLI